MATTSQAELEVWLIKNNPQVQHMLQNNQIKELLLEVYEEGKNAAASAHELTDDIIEEAVEEEMEEDYLTSYSALLTENL